MAAVDALRGGGPEAADLVPARATVRDGLVVDAAVAVLRPTRLAAGEGYVWAADDTSGTLTRIDGAGVAVRGRVVVGPRPTVVAAGLGAVWVLEEQTRSLLRVDPRTLGVVGRTPLEFVPTELALAPGAVWVTGYGGSLVARVDARDGRVALTVPIGRPTSVAVAGGTVWVLRPDAGVVAGIDAASGRPAYEIPLDAAGGRPEKLVAAGDALWVTVPGRRLLAELDARRRTLVRLLELPNLAPPFDVVAAGSSLWLQSLKDVMRLDPAGGALRVAGGIRLGRHPGPEPLGLGGLAAAGDAVWVADTHGSAVFRVVASG